MNIAKMRKCSQHDTSGPGGLREAPQAFVGKVRRYRSLPGRLQYAWSLLDIKCVGGVSPMSHGLIWNPTYAFLRGCSASEASSFCCRSCACASRLNSSIADSQSRCIRSRSTGILACLEFSPFGTSVQRHPPAGLHEITFRPKDTATCNKALGKIHV